MDTADIFFSDNREQNSPTNNQTFSDRQKILFDKLKVAELNTVNKLYHSQTPHETDLIINTVIKRNPNETKQFRGKESIFKRPEAPISKCLNRRSVPDFKRNPQRWIKYSLEDVSPEDMSSKGNTAAALSFLREMEERKEKVLQNDESIPEKIVFKTRKNKNEESTVDFQVSAMVSTTDNDEKDKPSFRSSKLVMPEYIVGQKVKKEKKKISLKVNKGKELKLDHLLQDDGDE